MSDEKNTFENEEEDYQNYIKDSLNEVDGNSTYTNKSPSEIVHIGKKMARRTNIMVSLAILLLIVPVMTLASYLYYGIGGRANHLIDVVTNTVYVTEPNMSLEKLELEDDIGFFTMNISFDVFKRIGKEDFKAGDYSIDFLLDQPDYPKRNMVLERPLPQIPSKDTAVMVHPGANPSFSSKDNWDILNKLPNGTVAEVYVSLGHVMKPEELKKSLPKNMDLRWLAVDTGLEGKGVDAEGVPIAPLGYPAQPDSTTWSPFKDGDNEKVFLDILSMLEKDEDIAQQVAPAKSLALSTRLAYIKKNGIKVYGAVITGPTEELRKLETMKEISEIKVGEVKLWNWE